MGLTAADSTHKDMITFVIPVFNEEAVIPQLVERLDALFERVDADVDVVFVNDGSHDGSAELIENYAFNRPYRLVNLSRNFGHQIAITAGVAEAQGDAIIIMDADLQDPPEVAIDMIEAWRNGYDVVSAKRARRQNERLFKRWTASVYYRLLAKMTPIDIPQDVGDFRLIDRKVADALNAMPEQDRYFRGMVSWVGFRQTQVTFERQGRAAGESKYPLGAMIRLAANGILGFSDLPLRIALWFGMMIAMASFAAGIFVFVGWLFGGDTVPGWVSSMLLLSFLSGVQLLTLGVVGLYVGRIYNEAKGRPLYLIDQMQDRHIEANLTEDKQAGQRRQ
ncbi:glycosyltransferase family 2 protein [Loktanella sp. S4079]|uniref:glycosyltransferase family 2 protein n=1 Tax=Loktanella sp. S4079 TaxID=579483 RepID=UPI0005F9DFAA|nr:glycosyltransferase family 2 protein [Loktanella sp. S4079]